LKRIDSTSGQAALLWTDTAVSDSASLDGVVGIYQGAMTHVARLALETDIHGLADDTAACLVVNTGCQVKAEPVPIDRRYPTLFRRLYPVRS
jgi:hypothetical protein